MISRNTAIVLFVLILISPVFGLILPEVLESEEYIESLAEKTDGVAISYSPFREYLVPGLPDWLGYIVSVALGCIIILAIYYTILKLAHRMSPYTKPGIPAKAEQ